MKCPTCSSGSVKLKGHIHNGKQNHLCKGSQKVISAAQKATIDKLLLEKISLAGIARVEEVNQV